MRLESVIYLLSGGTLGVLLRLIIVEKFDYKFGLTINNISTVNLISGFLVGIYIALNITSNNILLFFLIGFLGCFSTFSSFIFHLFILLKEQKYSQFIQHYIEILIYSTLIVCLGYFTTKIIFN